MSKKHNISRSRSYSPQSRTQRIAANGKTDTREPSQEFTLKELAGRENKHINTIRNWIHVGAKGRKLHVEWRGGEGFVTLASLEKFYGRAA